MTPLSTPATDEATATRNIEALGRGGGGGGGDGGGGGGEDADMVRKE